ncbi:hypothetical protein [Agrobacterium rosae]|uniref:hypothetical protein n=1 Tax=Agrobacterium rosae TaxID=1972867 RepID=UPI003BA1372D
MTTAKPTAPQYTRRHHLLRALRIAVGIALAVATTIYVTQFGGSILLLGAETMLIVACGPTMLKVLRVHDAIANGGELILSIFIFILLIGLLPFIALIFLLVELVRAVRADENAEV